MWCVNCQRDDHQADSRDCPAFKRMRDALREKVRTGGTLKEALASLDGKEKTKNSYHSYAAAAASGGTLASGANAEPLDLLRRLKAVEEELFALKTVTVPATLKVAESAQKTADETKVEVNLLKTTIDERLKKFFNKQNKSWESFRAEQQANFRSLQALMAEPAADATAPPPEAEDVSLVEMTDPRRDNQHPSPSAPSTVTVPSHIIQPMRRASGAATGGRGKPPPKPPTC